MTVDDTILGDHRMPCSVVLLARETVDIEVSLKPAAAAVAAASAAAVAAQPLCDDHFGVGPFGANLDGVSARDPPRGGTFEFDGLSKVHSSMVV